MGFLLLALGLFSMAVGLVYFVKMKRVASAPFRRTGEIAAEPKVADSRGMVSTEGRVVALSPSRAPCSGRACLYYEVTVERHWERTVRTRKETGKTQIAVEKAGALFQLDDASGPVSVDARDGADVDLAKAHEERIPVGAPLPAELAFGKMRLATPRVFGSDRTVAFTAVERILTADGSLYAYGKLANGVIGTPGWTPLLLSRKRRASLVGGTRMKAAAGLLAGGLLTTGAIPAFLLAPGPPLFGAAPDANASTDGVPSAAASSPPPPAADPVPTALAVPPRATVAPASPAPLPTPGAGKKEPGAAKSPTTRKK